LLTHWCAAYLPNCGLSLRRMPNSISNGAVKPLYTREGCSRVGLDVAPRKTKTLSLSTQAGCSELFSQHSIH
jgi:hypothetical protein